MVLLSSVILQQTQTVLYENNNNLPKQVQYRLKVS